MSRRQTCGFATLAVLCGLLVLVVPCRRGYAMPRFEAQEGKPPLPLPLAVARVNWKPEVQRYQGRVIFQIKSDATPETAAVTQGQHGASLGPPPHGLGASRGVSIVLLANAALRWLPDSRFREEFFSVGYPGEDLATVDRSGAMTVSQAAWVEAPAGRACSRELLNQMLDDGEVDKRGNTNTWLPVRWEYEPYDTAVRVDALKVPQAGCRALLLDFSFVPARQLGNNGVNGEGRATFSLGIVPMVRGIFHDTSVRFMGVHAECSACSREASGETLQRYKAFPSPLHMYIDLHSKQKSVKEIQPLQRAVPSQTSVIEGIPVTFIGSPAKGALDDAIKSLRRAILALAPEYREQLVASGWHPAISFEVLVERLSLAQPGEVQTGPSLFKTAPIFSRYHDASFTREFMIVLFEQLLALRSPPGTWSEYRVQTALARLVAEQALKSLFSNLDDFKRLSQRFDFIPLFEDILRGRALENNEVFLGEREPPSRVDLAFAELVVPHLGGKESAERFEYCLGPGASARVVDVVKQHLRGNLAQASLLGSIQNLGWDNVECPFEASQMLSRRPVREFMSVFKYLEEQGYASLVFKRTPRFDGGEDFFWPPALAGRDDIFRDAPRLTMMEKDNNKPFVDQKWITKSSGEEVIQERIQSEQEVEARISGPALGSNSDKHVYPRKYKFSLTGLKFSFSSQQEGARLESGIQFRLLGDDFSRAVTGSFAADGKQFEVGAGFRIDLKGFMGQGIVNMDSETEVGNADKQEQIFSSLPMSLGVVEVLPHAGSASTNVTAEFAAANESLDPMVPRGYRIGLRTRWRLFEEARVSSAMVHEGYTTFAQGLGRLTTFLVSPQLGLSRGRIRFSDYVPGASRDLTRLRSDEFFAMSSELRGVLRSGLNVDILGTLLFQNVVGYASHHMASDLAIFSRSGKVSDLNQSVQIGVQLFGAVFGAKNQSVGFSVTRAISDRPENSFALTIGK